MVIVFVLDTAATATAVVAVVVVVAGFIDDFGTELYHDFSIRFAFFW